jgi:hypothetical protein
MDKKKKNEFREKDYSRNSEGLKQRRLKEESRWRFNPNKVQDDAEIEDEEDDEEYGDWEQYRQGG